MALVTFTHMNVYIPFNKIQMQRHRLPDSLTNDSTEEANKHIKREFESGMSKSNLLK